MPEKAVYTKSETYPGPVPGRQKSSQEDVRNFLNSRIDQANARYSHFLERYNRTVDNLYLEECRSILEKYKMGTKAFRGE